MSKFSDFDYELLKDRVRDLDREVTTAQGIAFFGAIAGVVGLLVGIIAICNIVDNKDDKRHEYRQEKTYKLVEVK